MKTNSLDRVEDKDALRFKIQTLEWQVKLLKQHLSAK